MKSSFEAIAAFLGMIAIVIVLLGYPLMMLWNWLMPVIFGLPEITFWQAIGLNLLSTVLFKSTTIKKEGNNEIEVPLIKTSETADKFSTDRLTLIIRKSNPNFLPDDVKEDTELLDKINQGKVYSLLTAFPGNPDIPKASEWNGRFAVIVPKKESKINLNKDNETMK